MKTQGISFVFPMYNESENIANTIARAVSLAERLTDDYEIVVVDDASTDSSADIVDGLAADNKHIKSLRLKENTRFGGALSKGLQTATKDIIVYTDSDFPAKEEDIANALDLLDGADTVTAYSLVIKDSSLRRMVMSKVYNFLVQTLFGLRIRDINSGLKIYKKKAVEGLKLISRSPFVDVEIFVEIVKRKMVIKQYGLIFDLRTGGKSSIARFEVVLRTFFDMFRYRFFPHR